MNIPPFFSTPRINFDELIRHKVVVMESLQRLVAVWRMQSKKIVFTNGCFDLLHPGHIHLLNRARSFGDILIVGLNTDESMSKIKPGRPIQDEQSRSLLLASLEVVDAVIFFGEETPVKLIEELKPDVLVKGGDYTLDQVVGRSLVEKGGGKVEIVELEKGYSTSGLIEKIRGKG